MSLRNEYGEFLVECVNELCAVMPSTFPFGNVDKATEAWNRRVQNETN